MVEDVGGAAMADWELVESRRVSRGHAAGRQCASVLRSVRLISIGGVYEGAWKNGPTKRIEDVLTEVKVKGSGKSCHDPFTSNQ